MYTPDLFFQFWYHYGLSTDQIRRIGPSRKSDNRVLREQRSVLCTEAFAGYNILPDQAVVPSLIHPVKCKAKKQKNLCWSTRVVVSSLSKLLLQRVSSYLVTSENAEAVDDLFCRVGVGGFARHEIEESIEMNIARIVGINNGQNTLEVNVALPVLSDRVTQRYEARFKLVRCQSPCSILIEVIETAAEFIQLFLGDALQWRETR